MRTILTQPDPRLREISKPVKRFDASLEVFCQELETSMLAGPGGVGIAAPQVGELLKVIIVDCTHAMRPCKNHGLLYIVNPEILSKDGEVLGREGCLSVPDWVGMVPRARKIELRYQDIHGESQTIDCKGFEARVIQHEIDHLNGVLFTDRVVSTKDLVRRMQSNG